MTEEKRFPKVGQTVKITLRLDGGELGSAIYLGEKPYKIVFVLETTRVIFEPYEQNKAVRTHLLASPGDTGEKVVFRKIPARQKLPEEGRYFYVLDNPCFMLSDGSRVFGAECEWEE